VLQRVADIGARTGNGQAWSIRAYLIALALSSTVPIAVVAGFFAYHLVSDSSQRMRSDFEDRLRLLRNAIELRIANVIEDVEVLARSPALQRGDLAEFREHAARTVDMIGAFALVLADRDGQEVVNTREQLGAPLRRRHYLETLNRVVATGHAQVSDLSVATIDGLPFISVEVPARVDGEIRYVLALGLSPTYLSALMDEYVPPDLVGSIVDRKGILVARRPLVAGVDLVGQPTIPEVRAHLSEPSAFWIKAMSRSGTPTYTSSLRSDLTGWSINMALPRDAVDGPIWRIGALFTAVALAALLVSLVFARLVARRFLLALTGLEQHVMQLGTMRMIHPTPGPVAEVNRMETVLQRVGIEIAEVEEAIERERSLLRATVETIPIGVLLVTADRRISLVNRKMLSLCGADELRSLEDHDRFAYFHPDGTPYPAAELPITRALQNGETIEGEEVQHAVDGVTRHEVINAAPVRDSAGEIIAAVSACYDVTDVRNAMNRQQILLDEINHRVKNTLATVQSIARASLSGATTVEDYAASLERRLFALSGAYNVLTENNWEGADLGTIAQRTLAPYATEGRTSLSGPPLTLSPKLALAMSAAIQELSTNAAKYGALSTDEGRLEVSWSRDADGGISFSWVERDGPAVSKPIRRGFGTRLIQDILAAESGWNVTLDYAPAGLRCTMLIAGEQA
jgi:PAS domain S-box-containing protein